jgi:hypothetical protein
MARTEWTEQSWKTKMRNWVLRVWRKCAVKVWRTQRVPTDLLKKNEKCGQEGQNNLDNKNEELVLKVWRKGV